ncbi:MAG: hypothetical protein MI808_13410 [Pseudomonadales bacterium]|nr:hypothetical protein [Pseudomonadales bacterium]
MQSETTLNLKCPSCGSLTPKSLDLIKKQRTFECDCGYYADLRPRPFVSPEKGRTNKQGNAIPA